MSLKSLTKMSKNILIIAGHSGSGKSTVAKELHEKTGYELLGFSYAGRELANLKKFESRFPEINDYIYNCIINTVNNEGTVIVDGLASIDVLNNLFKTTYGVRIYYIETPYVERIKRMANRHGCSFDIAEKIEKSKAFGKANAGINDVLEFVDVLLDGNKSVSNLVNEIIEDLKNESNM